MMTIFPIVRFYFSVMLILLVSQGLVGQMTSSGWVSTIAGTGFETVAETKTDPEGHIYTIGTFTGTADFDGSSGVHHKTSKGESDVYVTKHNADGTLLWVSTFGGSQTEWGFSLDIHESGELYAVGTFEQEADFDPTDEDENLTSAGQEDIFIVKLTSAGELIWARRIGGPSVDEANDVAVDPNNGDLYVVGRFVNTVDFNPGAGTHMLSAGSTPDAFVLKLNANGEFLWAYDFGSGSNEEAEAVEVDLEHNVIIAGNFAGNTDFDPGAGQATVYGDGLADPFYLKLSPAGAFIWVTTFTSTGFVYAADIAIDEHNNILTHGFFSHNINFDPAHPNSVVQAAGAEDSYTAKLLPNGAVVWANILGGESIEFGYGVAVDAVGDVYVTGLYYDDPDFDPSNETYSLPSVGLEDTYIIKYSSQGHFIWAKRTGGSSGDSGYGIDISPTGDILVAGSYWGTSDLDPESDGTLNIQSRGGSDIFLLKIDQVISSTYQADGSFTEFSIRPNPASDGITITGEGAYPIDFFLLDASGRRISGPQTLQSPEQVFSLRDVPQGLYYVLIQSDTQHTTKKVIKL